MSSTNVIYQADGSSDTFGIPFPYLSTAHVVVEVNTSLLTVGTDYEWTTGGAIRLITMPGSGSAVTIKRVTPYENYLVSFTNGANLTAGELNIGYRHVLFGLQEITDKYNQLIEDSKLELASDLGIVTATGDDLLQIIIMRLLQDEALADLSQLISDVALNAQSILHAALLYEEADAHTHNTAWDLGNEIENRIAGYQANLNAILAEITARADADTVLDQQITALGVEIDNIGSATAIQALDTRITSNADGITASATDITALAVRITDAETDVDAAATAITALDTRVISTEAGLVAQAVDTTALESTVNDGVTGVAATAAAVGSLETRVTSTEGSITAQSSDITLLQSRVTDTETDVDASATAATVLTTRVTNAEGTITSQASQVTALQSTVGDNTADITSVSTTVNGLEAMYGVTLDVNGYVSGFAQNNNGVESNFTIVADRFALITPGETPVVPFLMTNGIVYMQDVVIGDAVISDLSVGTLTAGDLNVPFGMGTDGLIIKDNGIVMKVDGLGFGTTNQFVEWLGPSQDVSLCNEEDGTYWIRMDGSHKYPNYTPPATYDFNVVGTDTGVNAEITLGAFATSGATKTVTVEYHLFKRTKVTQDEATSNPGATLKLYRKIGTGAEVEVDSVTTTGTCVFTDLSGGEPGVNDWQTETMDTTMSYSDINGSTDDRTYRVALISRTLESLAYANGQPLKFTQTMALSSTEA